MAQHFDNVDEYIASFPAEVQGALQEIRRRCHEAVPESGETISYGIPSITLNGKYVVYFAGWAHHISVYPVPAGDEAFEAAIAPYRAARGTLKFPLGKPVPYELIEKTAALLAAGRHGSQPPSDTHDGGR
ncbi:iron chaperone [Arthrobacter sp. LjRoot14]|uniref:iron chaperone n=1 Tax=Arthrobacter sp. LjRoot14 TaxID=3342265 RepID=UPI003ECDF018